MNSLHLLSLPHLAVFFPDPLPQPHFSTCLYPTLSYVFFFFLFYSTTAVSY